MGRRTVSATFVVPVGEFDPSEFSTSAEVVKWPTPPGTKIVIEEYSLQDGRITTSDGDTIVFDGEFLSNHALQELTFTEYEED